MRRELRSWMVGAALGLALLAMAAAGPVRADQKDAGAPAASAPRVAVQVALPATGLRDEAAMVLIGTALIGLAAAVRRAA
jgi:hypothetical protein